MARAFEKPEPRFHNHILARLPENEVSLLWPRLTRVRMATGHTLYPAGSRITEVFFMEQGFVSLVAEADGPRDVVEVGVIGVESMVGLPVLFSESATSYNQVVVQAAGIAYRIPTACLLADLDELPTLRRSLNRAVELYMAQAAQNAACNGRHTLHARLARWLLTAHDRVPGDELFLTQETLSTMLAVRRSGVSNSIQALEAAGIVRHNRGRIAICDRPGLEDCACPCYARLVRFTERMAGASEIHPVNHRKETVILQPAHA